jgi:hypothetical protein
MLCLLLYEKKKEREKKEKGEMFRGLFPRADMLYWLCQARIFQAVRCN